MRNLDRSTHELSAACAVGGHENPTPTFQVLRAIPSLNILSVDFGPELSGQTRGRKVLAFIRTLPAIASMVRLVIWVHRRRVPIVHTSDRPRDAFGCVLLARLSRAKCIIHAHVGYGDWMSPLLKWSLKRADAVIAISEFVKETLVKGGLDGGTIYVVPNGIDPDDWSPGAGRVQARRDLGIPPNAPVVLTVCRLFPEKGPGDLIKALPALRAERADVRLVVVGEEMVRGYRDELERLSRDLGVADSVLFTGRRSDVPHLMAAADIYAMPSLHEPFGLVYLEAMAMQLPVVALRSGGAPEVIEDGRTGLLSEPGDIEGLSDHIVTLLRNPDRRLGMGAHGRRRVETRYTAVQMARGVADVYRFVTSRPQRIATEERGECDVAVGG
jgi:glycosyltransferase involved in cell wall biosynthesis